MSSNTTAGVNAPLNPMTQALLAVMASTAGDASKAQKHLEAAQQQSQCAARRHRQLLEIAGLVISGATERAAGLALVHTAQFPEDEEFFVRITSTQATQEDTMTDAVASPLESCSWPLHTPRLALRPATKAETESTWSFRRLDAVSQWLTRAPRTLEEYRAQFEDAASLAKTLVIELEGVVIGDLMLAIEDGWSQAEASGAQQVHAELGWVLHPHYMGNGYATEAASAVLRLCFETLGLRRVTADCFADNEASWRLMERLGMRREGHAVRASLHRSGEWMDTVSYAMLAEEWRQRQSDG